MSLSYDTFEFPSSFVDGRNFRLPEVLVVLDRDLYIIRRFDWVGTFAVSTPTIKL